MCYSLVLTDRHTPHTHWRILKVHDLAGFQAHVVGQSLTVGKSRVLPTLLPPHSSRCTFHIFHTQSLLRYLPWALGTHGWILSQTLESYTLNGDIPPVMPQEPARTSTQPHISKRFENRHSLKSQTGGKSLSDIVSDKWKVWILLFVLSSQLQSPALNLVHRSQTLITQIQCICRYTCTGTLLESPTQPWTVYIVSCPDLFQLTHSSEVELTSQQLSSLRSYSPSSNHSFHTFFYLTWTFSSAERREGLNLDPYITLFQNSSH